MSEAVMSGTASARHLAGPLVTIGGGGLGPTTWMFLAILVTFLITRLITRLIRSGSGVGVGDVSLGGVHLHHQVFGILIMIGSGIALVSATPAGVALDVIAALFGVGISLTLDEFALWLHLEDVYWSNEGRKSVDAVFCVLLVTGILVGGVNVFGDDSDSGVWSSLFYLAVNLLCSVICLLKGKVVTGVVGIVLPTIAVIGAFRLAKPTSWWARRRYASRPKRAARAEARFGARYESRWNRMRDLVAGAPGSASSAKLRE